MHRQAIIVKDRNYVPLPHTSIHDCPPIPRLINADFNRGPCRDLAVPSTDSRYNTEQKVFVFRVVEVVVQALIQDCGKSLRG